jgi:hypothetical protein
MNIIVLIDLYLLIFLPRGFHLLFRHKTIFLIITCQDSHPGQRLNKNNKKTITLYIV